MAQKRCFNGDAESGTEDTSANDNSKRFKNANIRDLLGMLSFPEMVEELEPRIREVIRDEVEKTFARFCNHQSFIASFNQGETSGRRGLLLRFVNNPPGRIFTNSKMEDEDGNPIRIELLDAATMCHITSGHLSSLKIEVLVVDADFSPDDQEHWTESQFNDNIVRERENRRPLVTGGDLNVQLRGGVALISDVAFTDNSSWQRSRKFRLGVKATSQTGVQEAVSEAFMVMDHRGELYKKHYPPRFNDEVWRLKNIAKEGPSHKKLSKLGVNTVENFLQWVAVNPSELRGILGAGISKKIWDTIIEHANTCVLDDKLYVYYESEQGIGLLFNSVYKLMGTYHGQFYEPLHNLNPPLKALVENSKRQAYKNVDKFVPIDPRQIAGLSRSLTCPQTDSFHGQNLSLPQLLSVGLQEPSEALIDFGNAENVDQFQISLPPLNTNQNNLFPSNMRNSFKFSDIFIGDNHCTTSTSQWPLMTTTNLLTDQDMSQHTQTSTWSANDSSNCWGQGNTIIFSPGNEEEVGFFMSRIRKPKAGWCKLRAAIKLGLVRRCVAAKSKNRMWQGCYAVDY